jgi:type I restriction enzyme, S subunit
MPIPSLDEQAVIVSELEELIEREGLVLNLVSNEKKLDVLKQSILFKAFRGELGTNDPSEESAIELLKEVLQERRNGCKKTASNRQAVFLIYNLKCR